MTVTQKLMYCASAGYFACLYTVGGAVIGGAARWVRSQIRRGR